MLEQSEVKTLNQLTLFAGASLASLTVLPGSDEAQKMTAISGRNIAALLERSSPLGSLARMFLESSQPFSTKCFLTWKTWTTRRGRLIFRLAPSMPHTGESEFSLLPTPTANDQRQRFNQSLSSGSAKRPNLAATAHFNLWPTPTVADIKTYWHHRRGGNPSLAGAVKMWPTQTVDAARNSTNPPSQADRHTSLPAQVGGTLNPEWVEWLMGFPIGWTDLDHSETP